MAKKQKTKELPKETPFERQKKLASSAKEVLDANHINSFIGEYNDQSFYLVLENHSLAEQAQTLLTAKDLQTTLEDRPMINDSILYISDKPETTEEEMEDETENE